MTEQPYDDGDLSYDSAHEAHVAQRPHPARRDGADPPSEPPGDLIGDYSYDLAHDALRD